MAATEYMVLTRSYNENTNQCVTNTTDVEWVGNGDPAPLREFVKEVLTIDDSNDGVTSPELQRVIIENAKRSNPKFDMIFCFSGVDMIGEELPFVVCDQFYRIQGDPWFKNSYIGSLSGAMSTVKRLSSVIGKDNVMLGKVVPLEEYIDIE